MGHGCRWIPEARKAVGSCLEPPEGVQPHQPTSDVLPPEPGGNAPVGFKLLSVYHLLSQHPETHTGGLAAPAEFL